MRYLYTFLIVISIFLNWRCSSEINIDRDTNDSIIHEVIPVDFNIEGIISMNSRDIHSGSKRNFKEGEMIHVGATFYDSNGDIIKHDYTVMYLKDGKWAQGSYKEMIWPPDAYNGEFKAYYIDNIWYTDVKLTQGDHITHVLNLSDFKDDTDPLYAERKELWGHTINLRFSHLCTHLTFTNLDPDIADYFWLINKGNKDFNNGFSLKVTDDNELKAEFSQIKDNNYDGGLIYVQHPSDSYYDEEDNSKKSRVSFFLEPGDYSDIELRTINNYSYLAFQSEETGNLEANIPYVIEVNKSSGTTFIEKKEDWDIPENWEATEVEPKKFIESIVKGSDYFIIDEEKGDTIMIIERTLVGTALRRNVDFKYNKEYVDLLDVRPEIGSNQVFDGGNHFICNIATNIFTENHGTIKNLGLHSVICDVTVSQNNEYWGVLCQQNVGNISDIRLDESDIKINIGDHTKVTSIMVGSLIGWNLNGMSNVKDIVYSGNLKLETEDRENVDCSLYLGGFIGQLVSGTINGIKLYDNGSDALQSKIEIINHLKGQNGSFYVGGGIGVGITDIEKINLHNVLVDCSDSKGQNEYTGGLIGQLRSSLENPSIMSLCSVEGKVKGGDIENDVNISSKAFSYTGGITGSMLNYKVLDCSAICEVQGPVNAEIKEDETYATGGAFGIIGSKTDVKNNVAWGTSLAGPTGGYIGNFAGIAPEGCDWDYYYSSGNRAFDLLGPREYVGFNQ